MSWGTTDDFRTSWKRLNVARWHPQLDNTCTAVFMTLAHFKLWESPKLQWNLFLSLLCVWFIWVFALLVSRFTHLKNVSLCNDQCWAGRLIVRHDKNVNVAIFSDPINVIYVGLFMVVLLKERYLFILLSVTVTIFQSHRSVKQCKLKILCLYFLSSVV